MTDDLPPSATHVRYVLNRLGGRATRQELLEEADIKERTFDDALRRLEENGEIARDAHESDLRATVFIIRG